MYLVILAWGYVVLMMVLAEALSPNGTLLGAFFTLLLYGVGPMALVIYLVGTPLRRRHRRRLEAEAAQGAQASPALAPTVTGSSQPGGGSLPATAAQDGGVAPVREKP
jgi:hypothetical protein